MRLNLKEKLIFILLSFALVFGLFSCSDDQGGDERDVESGDIEADDIGQGDIDADDAGTSDVDADNSEIDDADDSADADANDERDVGEDAAGDAAEDAGLVEVDAEEIEELAKRMSTAFCDRSFNCCTTTEISEHYGSFFNDEETCQDKVRGNLPEEHIPLLIELIESGKIIYHEELAADCLSAHDELDCAEVQPLDPLRECLQESMEGTAAGGEECRLALECADGACVGRRLDDDGLVIQPGVCTEIVDENEPCEHDAECPGDLICLAQDCTPPGEDDFPCGSDLHCAEGYFCDNNPFSDTPTATCTPYRDVGEKCHDKECGPDHYCDRSGLTSSVQSGRCAQGTMCNGAD